jgi:cytochrome c oxidase subunit 2
VQKGWSFFFGAVLLAELVSLVISPAMGWWLPENISTYGGSVDLLFYVILGFTGFFFILTEAILVYNMYAFAYREGHRAQYVEGNHRLELAWTIVPAAILLYIAYVQIETWAEIKYQSRTPTPDQVVTVTAHQWEWRMRYFPGEEKKQKDDKTPEGDKAPEKVYQHRPMMDGNYDDGHARAWGAGDGEFDDLHGVNELHTWKGANVKIFLKTRDVIHSFFLPNLRLKQDALPGKTIPMWFNATEANVEYIPGRGLIFLNSGGLVGRDEPTRKDREFEITCAELCGGFHYRMRGQLYVHKDKESYEAWLAEAHKQQRSRQPEKREPVASAGAQ